MTALAPRPSVHADEADLVCAALGVDAARGLDDSEAARRLAEVGPNELERPARPAYASLALRQLLDPLVGLLIAATAVSALVGEQSEALAVGAIVVLNAAFGFVQEAGAERAVLALREQEPREAVVRRGGRLRRLAARELVPGDVIVLHEGDRVPADARLVAAQRLELDESALTGESVPVEKAVGAVAPGTPVADRSSIVHAGTGVTAGRATAVVVATGAATELGVIARLVGEARPPATPLQRRLGGLARSLVLTGAGITVLLFAGMLLHGASAREAFLVGVAVAVAAVPEGLAATVTIALALGAREMAARGAIVRRLSAIETLGETTVICADKTGTLTQNRLQLHGVVPMPGTDEDTVLAAAVLASAADVGSGGGDALELALVRGAAGRGVLRDELVAARRHAHEIPFRPERKRMTVVWEEEDGHRAFTKGAPEDVLRLTQRDAAADRIEDAVAVATGQGLRVLAVAERRLGPGEPPGDAVERDLRLLGLVTFQDPLRPGARHAVLDAARAGVRVVMLTGDHPATAAAIGAEVGLPPGAVHARVTPAQKLELVEVLQQEGEVVAVTGDGVNDSPALRRADAGLAMGRSGTEAAREAAAIVITDDDFATIVAALSEGRRVAENIRKFVAFLLSANLGEVLLFAAAVLSGLGAPMSVAQVLAVNLLTDGLPALALARDPATPELMARGPFRRGPLLSRALTSALAVAGVAVGGVGLAAYLAGGADDSATGRTMAFATVALAELVFVFACRSPSVHAWRAPRNLLLVGSVAASAALVVASLTLPPARALLGTTPLSGTQVAVVAVLAVVPTALVEAAKAMRRRRGRS